MLIKVWAQHLFQICKEYVKLGCLHQYWLIYVIIYNLGM